MLLTHWFEFKCVRNSEFPFGKHENNKNKLPVVFVHGLGIGFGSYLGIISSFPTEVDVILVEWHHVSMQLESHVPSIDATVKSICNMLDSYSHTQAWYADFHCMLYTFTCICIHTHLSYVFVHTHTASWPIQWAIMPCLGCLKGSTPNNM